MELSIILVSAFLWLWFLGCTISWRFGKVLLVEGTGFKHIEFVALILYSIGFLLFFLYRPIGQWVLTVELALWLIVQFLCHEYYTIFGASEQKLRGYNQCFAGSLRLFPESDTRLVPDLYHIVLHLLLAADLTLLICFIAS